MLAVSFDQSVLDSCVRPLGLLGLMPFFRDSDLNLCWSIKLEFVINFRLASHSFIYPCESYG